MARDSRKKRQRQLPPVPALPVLQLSTENLTSSSLTSVSSLDSTDSTDFPQTSHQRSKSLEEFDFPQASHQLSKSLDELNFRSDERASPLHQKGDSYHQHNATTDPVDTHPSVGGMKATSAIGSEENDSGKRTRSGEELNGRHEDEHQVDDLNSASPTAPPQLPPSNSTSLQSPPSLLTSPQSPPSLPTSPQSPPSLPTSPQCLSSPDSLANEVQLLLNEIRKPVNNSNGGAKEQIVSTEDSGSVETGDHFPANKVQHLLDELQRPVNNSNLGAKEQIVSTKDSSSGEAGDHLPATDIGGREVVPASDSKGGGGEDVVSPSSEGGNVPVNHRNGSEGGGDVPVNGTSVEDNSWEREHVRQLTHHHLSVSSDQVCTRNVMCPLADMRRGCCVLYSRCR